MMNVQLWSVHPEIAHMEANSYKFKRLQSLSWHDLSPFIIYTFHICVHNEGTTQFYKNTIAYCIRSSFISEKIDNR